MLIYSPQVEKVFMDWVKEFEIANLAEAEDQY